MVPRVESYFLRSGVLWQLLINNHGFQSGMRDPWCAGREDRRPRARGDRSRPRVKLPAEDMPKWKLNLQRHISCISSPPPHVAGGVHQGGRWKSEFQPNVSTGGLEVQLGIFGSRVPCTRRSSTARGAWLWYSMCVWSFFDQMKNTKDCKTS